MSQPADAIVTGFVKSAVVLERSLAPVRRLRQEGVIRRVLYVTWDTPEIDEYIAPLAEMPDVSLVRVAQETAEGTGNQRGVLYQARNLAAALALIAEDDALVLKLRPDFIVDADFLRRKIANFDTLCTRPARTVLGVAMPAPAFTRKIWIPWADSNQPFFYEDAAFLGRKVDLCKLVTDPSRDEMEILGDPSCGSFAHVVRYARIFLEQYPLFAKYLRNYRYFVNDMDYRQQLVPHLLSDGFFWHALIAHAWILYSQFHVDAGHQGDLIFYANTVNRNADWAKPESLRNSAPYDYIDMWRLGTRPGEVFPSVKRVYGRLMDDAWQTALFTSELPDLPRTTLTALLRHVAGCTDGRLGEIENDFYRSTAALYHRCWTGRASQRAGSIIAA